MKNISTMQYATVQPSTLRSMLFLSLLRRDKQSGSHGRPPVFALWFHHLLLFLWCLSPSEIFSLVHSFVFRLLFNIQICCCSSIGGETFSWYRHKSIWEMNGNQKMQKSINRRKTRTQTQGLHARTHTNNAHSTDEIQTIRLDVNALLMW